VQFVHLSRSRVESPHVWSPLKRRGARTPAKHKSPRARVTPQGSSAKVREIVRLVQALSGDLGSHDGVVVGRGIAHLLVEAYGERRAPVPSWVKELLAQFDPGKPRP
jgi:hypothetical protein